jgi:hypothetical protein
MITVKLGFISFVAGIFAAYASWGYGYTIISVRPDMAWNEMWVVLVLIYSVIGAVFGYISGVIRKRRVLITSYLSLLVLLPLLVSIHTVYWIIPIVLGASMFVSYFMAVYRKMWKFA